MKRTPLEREANMQFQTTVKEFSKKVRTLGLAPDAELKIIVRESHLKTDNLKKTHKKPYLPFLDGEVWEGKDPPTDLAENHDHYLYDLDNPHGK